MELTGKAKKDFELWNNKLKEDSHSYIDIEPTSINISFNDLYDNLQNTIIIDWLDSVGIYLTIGRYGYMLNSDNIQITRKTGDTRQEATKQAIIKANDIYNLR